MMTPRLHNSLGFLTLINGEEQTMQRSIRTVLLASVCALALSGAAVAVASPANALVNDNESKWQEPQHNPPINGRVATQVYELRSEAQFPGSTTKVVDVLGGATNQGAALALWHRGTPDEGPPEAAQPNQSWEFIPHADNTGGTIQTGYGWLRGRHSGLCLDITGGNDAVDGTPVSLHPCHDGANQQFMVRGGDEKGFGGVIVSAPFADGQSWLLERGHQGCNEPAGDPLTATREPTAQSCINWSTPKASYTVATHKIWTGLTGSMTDTHGYSCLDGYSLFRSVEDYWSNQQSRAAWDVSELDAHAHLWSPVETHRNGNESRSQEIVQKVNKVVYQIDDPKLFFGTWTYQSIFVCHEGPGRIDIW
jgi:hypothetical protein